MADSLLHSLEGTGGAGVVVALTEAVKRAGNLPKRWVPLVAILLGVALNVLLALAQGDPCLPAVTYGLVAGVVASGLYAGVTATTSPASAKRGGGSS